MFVATNVFAQRESFGTDEYADVIDHTRFDSLWHEAQLRGRLNTQGWDSEAYRTYRLQLSSATPMAFLPKARTAFWVNAYLACLMEVMHLRVGYRSTVWDTLWLRRDTFYVAGQPSTLDDLRIEAVRAAGTVAVWGCLPTGSQQGAPFPSRAATARNIRVMIRDQMRRICRSERYLMFDPAGNVLQISRFFSPIVENMVLEAKSVAQWVLPYVSYGVAAQLALHAPYVQTVVSDVIETWRKSRPP